MATPYKDNTVDFDNIFEPIGSETKAADVGYKIGGQDISNRYYPLSAGGSAVTGLEYTSSTGTYDNTNLGNIFAGVGTVTYNYPTYVARSSSAVNTGTSVINYDIYDDGVYDVNGTSSTGGDVSSESGPIAEMSGDPLDYEFRILATVVTNTSSEGAGGIYGAIDGNSNTITVFPTPWLSWADVNGNIGPFARTSMSGGSSGEEIIEVDYIIEFNNTVNSTGFDVRFTLYAETLGNPF